MRNLSTLEKLGLVFMAFYLPGAMLLIGGAFLGYTMEDMRDGIAFFGSFLGFIASASAAVALFLE